MYGEALISEGPVTFRELFNQITPPKSSRQLVYYLNFRIVLTISGIPEELESKSFRRERVVGGGGGEEILRRSRDKWKATLNSLYWSNTLGDSNFAIKLRRYDHADLYQMDRRRSRSFRYGLIASGFNEGPVGLFYFLAAALLTDFGFRDTYAVRRRNAAARDRRETTEV